MQRVHINQERAKCAVCGSNLLEITNFKYAGKTLTEPTHSDEVCICRICRTQFLLRYDFFDEDGHINPYTFSEDANDPEYNWQDNLTDEQRKIIASHLQECPVCQDRLSEQILKDAWFADILHKAKT
jgi:hypothetical protein